MQKLLIILLLTFCACLPAAAQKKTDGNFEKQRKELLDFKVKYLVQEIDVPADKRAEFESTYRQMEQERHVLFSNIHAKAKALSKASSDAEVLAVTDLIAGAKQKEGAIESKYYQIFKKMLTPRQLLNMKRSEDRFNRKVMQMRNKKGGKNKNK